MNISRRCAFLVLVVVSALSFAGRAHAASFDFISQSRSITATTTVELNGRSDTKGDDGSSSTLGLYSDDASGTAHVEEGSTSITGVADASQDSDLRPFHILIKSHLSNSAITEGSDFQTLSFDATSETRLDTRFRLSDPSVMSVGGDINTAGTERTNFAVTFILTDPNGVENDLRSFGDRPLDAGTYDLSFFASLGVRNSIDPEAKFADFDITLDFTGGQAAISLPQALWVGMATLTAAWGARRITRAQASLA